MFSLSAFSSLFLFTSSLLLLSATPALANRDLDRRSTPHDNRDVLAEVLKRAFAEAATSAAEELQRRSWDEGGEWLGKREASDTAIAHAEELESRDWAGLDLAERTLSDPDTADVLTARDLDDLFERDYHAHLLRSRQLFGAGKAKAGAAGAGAAAAGGKAAKLKALIDKLKAAKAAKAAAAAGAAGAAGAGAGAAGAAGAGAAGAADAAAAATTTTAAAADAAAAVAASSTSAAAAATTSANILADEGGTLAVGQAQRGRRGLNGRYAFPHPVQ